jgi:aldehyde dehydrogenase (NAD+)
MHQLYIDGQWVAPATGQSIPVEDPSTGDVFTHIARGDAADIGQAVTAARHALTGPWSRLSATSRGRLLLRLSQLITANADALTELEARDTGKPLPQARADIKVLARYFEFYASAADQLHGEVIPIDQDYHVSAVREPCGVTAHITPWNYPAAMFGRTLAPALAMGNAVVLKPAEDACLTSLRLADLAAEAGFPPGVLNIVTGYGHEAGAALAAHPDINFMSFTGSPQVGALIQKATADNHVRCVLELGGKSPHVIFDDADLARAVPTVVKAIIQNAGQTCSAGSRVIVQQSIYNDFTRMLCEQFNQVRVGTPDMQLDCGPLINAKQHRRVEGMIASAIASGLPVMARGRLADGLPSGGYYVEPVVFGPVPCEHPIALQEVFGPVLAVIPFENEAEALAIANGTDFGLVAAVWTRDGGRQMRLAKQIASGQVYLNCYGAGGGVELPFGGVKKSGYGREKGAAALEDVSVLKTIVQFHGN